MSEYRKETDPQKLEPYFTKHMSAMTSEDLHSKSDIAIELAYRDKQIADIQALREKVEAMRPFTDIGTRRSPEGIKLDIISLIDEMIKEKSDE